jgi:hypothetical protein
VPREQQSIVAEFIDVNELGEIDKLASTRSNTA